MGNITIESTGRKNFGFCPVISLLRVGRAYGCHPVLDRLRQPFLNKGNSDGPCCGLFQWPEVG